MMSSLRTWGPWCLLVLVLAVIAVIFAGKTAGPSVLSRGPAGWLGARKYLEERGIDVLLLDRPLGGTEEAEVLVTAFPWQQSPPLLPMDPIRSFVREGGTLLIGYSGELGGTKEQQLLELLEAPLTKLGPEPPLAPVAWWRHRQREWTLVPTQEVPGNHRGHISAAPAVPRPPERARILHRLEMNSPLNISPESPLNSSSDSSWAATMDFSLGQGHVVLFPAELISNARLSEAGSVQALEALIALAPPGPWAFDEFAHGLRPMGEDGGPQAPQVAFDLFVGHLFLLYLLALTALARRFGPPFKHPPIQAGSAAAFLRGLGTLHHRCGHHARAAELLLERTQALDPRRQIPPSLAALASGAGPRAFVRLAQGLAQKRSPDGPNNKE